MDVSVTYAQTQLLSQTLLLRFCKPHKPNNFHRINSRFHCHSISLAEKQIQLCLCILIDIYIRSCFCPPSERSRVIHPSGCHAPSLQHQDSASTGHRVCLCLHPGPTGRKCTDEHMLRERRYVSQLKASKLTLRYQLVQSHFLPAFES